MLKSDLFVILSILTIYVPVMNAQRVSLHSHNDYLRQYPFWEAYIAGCSSIEADVILRNDTLYVAHGSSEIKTDYTFENLYVKPLSVIYDKHCPWNDLPEERLQFLVDIKSESISTLRKLMEILSHYPQYFNPTVNPYAVRIVISGNRPDYHQIHSFPEYVYYDLRKPEEVSLYQKQSGLISRNFADFSTCKGTAAPDNNEIQKLETFVKSCHALNMPVRFWNAPDNENAYGFLMKLGVDLINTDRPLQAASFLSCKNENTVK